MLIKRPKSAAAVTLIELMVVILIVGILAVTAGSLFKSRTNEAKWTEAHTTCGAIWSAVRTYIAEKGRNYAGYSSDVVGPLSDITVCKNLGFNAGDLEGRYFAQGDYEIQSLSGSGPDCSIEVVGSKTDHPDGTGKFVVVNGQASWKVQ